jgi:predicted chitinase
MSQSNNYLNHIDLTKAHHRAFFQAVLDRLFELDPKALDQGSELRDIWVNAVETKAPSRVFVTADQAKQVFLTDLTPAQLDDLNQTLLDFNITTPLRIAHFLAQLHAETNGLKWLVELASGDAYEGVVRGLGNTKPGDGRKFKGAGAIQLTGRANYQDFADFVKDPKVMEIGHKYVAERYPFMSAGFWWKNNNMNAAIEAGADARRVSRLVNGRDPANGLDKRLAAFARASTVFGLSGPTISAAGGSMSNRPMVLPNRIGPKQHPRAYGFTPKDFHLIVDDGAQTMTAFSGDGKVLWKIPALARGQREDTTFNVRNSDTPPGVYEIVEPTYDDISRLGEALPPFDQTLLEYGWIFFTLKDHEHAQAKFGRSGIGLHGGGTACGWDNPGGAWSKRQRLHPTLGCIRIANEDLRDKVKPLTKRGRVFISVYQEAR